MDKLEQYRQWIQALLTEYVATPISNGAIDPKRFLIRSGIIIR